MYYGKQYPQAFQKAVAGVAKQEPELLKILRDGPASVTRLEFTLRSSPSAKGDILEKHREALSQADHDPEQTLEAVRAIMRDLEYLDEKQRVHRECENFVPPIFRTIR